MLEERRVLATFMQFGTELNLDLTAANTTLAVTAEASNYRLTLTGGDTWTSSNITGATVSGGTSLLVTKDVFTTINVADSNTGAAVNFNNSGANTYTDNLSVVLDAATAGTITFVGATSMTDSNSLSVSTARNIALNSASTVSTVNGNLTMRANQQATPTAGNFQGISLSNAGISSATGDILLEGRGGIGSGINNHGVSVGSSGVIASGGTGTVMVVGTGGGAGASGSNHGVSVGSGGTITNAGTGAGATVTVKGTGGNTGGSSNFGVSVVSAGSTITSSGGAVLVEGTGGGAGSSAGNFGVFVESAGAITSAGTGAGATVTVKGTGGNTRGNNNFGVLVVFAGSTITSSGGAVLVEGTGGGAGASGDNYGVYVAFAGTITSAGTGAGATVTVKGTGGNTGGTGGDSNHGVYVRSFGSTITSSGGAVLVEGTGGGAGSSWQNYGVFVVSAGQITSGGTGTVTLVGNGGAGVSQGVLVSSASVSSAGGNIGVTGIGSGGAASIQATGIDAGTGVVTLTAPTGFIREAEAGTDVAGSDVIVNGEVAPAGPGATGQMIFKGDVTFTSGDAYSVELNGLNAGAASVGYDQLQVTGTAKTVNLGNSTLNVNLGFTPVAGDAFVIVDNVDSSSSVTGNFAGLPDGTAFTVGSTVFHIFYNAGTDNNDVVLIVNRGPTDPADVDNSVNEVDEGAASGTTLGVIASSSDPDGDTLTYSLSDDDGGRFAIDSSTGVVTVANGALLDGPDTRTIVVQASDGLGGTSQQSFAIQINNVAPEITELNSSNSDMCNSAEGSVTITGAFFDPALDLDTHTVTVNWGDGTQVTLPGSAVDQVNDTFTAGHDYQNGGIYTITVTVTDSDGDVSMSETTTAVMQGVGIVDGTLYIIGTPGRDHVNLKFDENKDELKVDVKLNQGGSEDDRDRIQLTIENASSIQRIVAYLCDGDDHYLGGDLAISQFVFGGAGDDHIQGGHGNDVLVGGSGNDHIHGGDGMDILIGGTGQDNLHGGRGNDLLIGGSTENQDDLASLDAALADWVNGDWALALFDLGDIIDDEEEDDLKGEEGLDLLFGGLGDKVKQ